MRFADLVAQYQWRIAKEDETGAFAVAIKREVSLAAIWHANVSFQWPQLYRFGRVITLVSGTDSYTLPIDTHKVFVMWHEIDDARQSIPFITPKKWYQSYLSRTDTDTRPRFALISEETPVLTQPSSASVITVVSSVATDTTIKVYVSGLVSGYPDSETISLNTSDSTTSSAGAKSFTRLDRISLSGAPTGRVTLTSNSGVVTNFVLPAGSGNNVYLLKRVKFWPIPSAANTIYYTALIRQYYMTDDNDTPVLQSPEHDEAILQLAEANYRRDAASMARYKSTLKSLMAESVRNPGEENVIFPGDLLGRIPGEQHYGSDYPYPYGA
jgi:hypothetical protein